MSVPLENMSVTHSMARNVSTQRAAMSVDVRRDFCQMETSVMVNSYVISVYVLFVDIHYIIY